MDGTFGVGPHDEVGPLEKNQPRRKSSNIPLPESHVQRTRSEVQLCEDMESAEHREWNMFSRVVNGRIRERPPSRVGTVDGATAASTLTPPQAWTDDDDARLRATATPLPPPPNPISGGGATEALKNLGLVGNQQNTAWSDSSGFDDSGFQHHPHQQQQQFFHQPLHQYQHQPQQTSSNYAGATSASASSSSSSSSPLTHNFATAAAYAVAATTATTAALPNALQQYTYSSFASMGTVEEETGIFDFDMDM